MGVEPLTHVALVGVRAARELVRGLRAARGQRAIQAEFIADQHQRGERGGAHVIDGAS